MIPPAVNFNNFKFKNQLNEASKEITVVESQESQILSENSDTEVHLNESEEMTGKIKSEAGTTINKSESSYHAPPFIKTFVGGINPSTPAAEKLQENLSSNPIFMKIFSTNYRKFLAVEMPNFYNRKF